MRKIDRSRRLGWCIGTVIMALAPTWADEAPSPATPLQDGAAASVITPAKGPDQRRPLWFTHQVDDHTVERFDLHIDAADPKKPAGVEVQIFGNQSKPLYDYRADYRLTDYLYFPVLDAGTYRVSVVGREPATKLSVTFQRLKVEVTEADRSGAAAAIERASEWLAKTGPKQARDGSNQLAIESLVMAALQSDRSGKYRHTVDNDYIPYIKSQFKQQPDVLWEGEPVTGFGSGGRAMYQHALATLALAETASTTPAGRELAEQAARFLLACQTTPRRPTAWKPVKPDSVHRGGWRYQPASQDADLSVTGWCVVALHACYTAGINPPGERQALDDAMEYVRRCEGADGFGYTAGSDATGSIRDSIGALLCTLDGSTDEVIDSVYDRLDRELFAGTQTDRADDYPLYYAYYATRLNYLRGGFVWEAWRMTAIRQLLKLQRPDGSFPVFATEKGETSDRYGTALSVLILRTCLNDVPDYLKQQAKGF